MRLISSLSFDGALRCPLCSCVLPPLCCNNWVWEGSQVAPAALWALWHCCCPTAAPGWEGRALGRRGLTFPVACVHCNLPLCIKFEVNNRKIIHKPGGHITKWRRNFCFSFFLHLYLILFVVLMMNKPLSCFSSSWKIWWIFNMSLIFDPFKNYLLQKYICLSRVQPKELCLKRKRTN